MFERGFPSLGDDEDLPHYNEIPSRFETKKKLRKLKRRNPCCDGCAEGKSCSGKRNRRNPSCCSSCEHGGTCSGSRRNPDPFSSLYPEKGLFARRNPANKKSHCKECALDCNCSPGYECTTCTDHRENLYYSKLTRRPRKSIQKLADEILQEDADFRRNPDPFSTLYPERGLFARNPVQRCKKCEVEIDGKLEPCRKWNRGARGWQNCEALDEYGCWECKGTGIRPQTLCASCQATEFKDNPEPFSTLYPERGLFARNPEQTAWCEKCGSEIPGTITGLCVTCKAVESRENPDPFSTLYPERGLFARRKLRRRNPDPFSTLYPERGLFARRKRNPDPFSTLYPEKGLFARRQRSRLRHRNPHSVFNTPFPNNYQSLFRNPVKWKHNIGQRVRRKWDKKWGDMPAYYGEGHISSQIESADNRGKKKPGYTVGWKGKLDDSVSRAPWLEGELDAYRRHNPFEENEDDINAVACNENCLTSYQEDLEHGLTYGPYILNGQFVSPEEFSRVTGHCVYCGSNTAKTAKFTTRPDWSRKPLRRFRNF